MLDDGGDALARARDREKELAARAAVALVAPHMIVGLGSGTTAAYAVRALGERVAKGLSIIGVPTSLETELLAREVGIPILGSPPLRIDLTIDGADEFDGGLHLLKGAGGALVREKVVASVSEQLIIVCDSSKRSDVLGRAALPVAVVPFALQTVARRVSDLGARVTIRSRKDEPSMPYLTDDAHCILDCRFQSIRDPVSLGRMLRGIPGVVEHGLFFGYAMRILVGRGDVVEELRSGDCSCAESTVRPFPIAGGARS